MSEINNTENVGGVVSEGSIKNKDMEYKRAVHKFIDYPDPFVVTFTSGESVNTISFFKDGRVESEMPKADEATRLFLKLLQTQYYDFRKAIEGSIQDSLMDPSVVYNAMLRGNIASPAWSQICHLYPEESMDTKFLEYLTGDNWHRVVRQDNEYVVSDSSNRITGRGKTPREAISNSIESDEDFKNARSDAKKEYIERNGK